MKIRPLEIPGCYEVLAEIHVDDRGFLAKVFHRKFFKQQGLRTDFVEDFYSLSRRGVLRGLHFQRPPHALAKLVYCIYGAVQDVVLDLRRGSPTYMKHLQIELSAKTANMIYIPEGLAHGFYVTSPQALTVYKVTAIHSPTHDSGVRWDSAGIEWPSTSPIVSNRDQRLVPVNEYKSPFVFNEKP